MNPKKEINSDSTDRNNVPRKTGRSVLHTDFERSRSIAHRVQLWAAGLRGSVSVPHQWARERSTSATTGAATGTTRRESSRIGKVIAATNSVSTLRPKRICVMASIVAHSHRVDPGLPSSSAGTRASALALCLP
ncbi:hypothetical protein BJ996_007101 [Streptomyces phaeogriseichromatogenes]|nr:hypothetical protein [Streptomyces murinus]